MNGAPHRWAGPALAAIGGIGIAILLQRLPGSHTLMSWWLLNRALSIEKALPLIGLGAAIALLDPLQALLSCAVFLLGALLGFHYHDAFLAMMAFVPNAPEHLFLAGPIALVASGALLLCPPSLRHWLAPALAAIIGAMLAQFIALTDPTIGSPAVSFLGVGLGMWSIATVSLCLRSVLRPWFAVASRIAGSWLVAIGLLYGGSAFAPRKAMPPLPDAGLDDPLLR